MNATNTLWLALGAAALAVVYGVVTVSWLLGRSPGNARMQEIAGVVLLVILGVALNWLTAIGFAIGAIFSGLAGYIGMFVSVRANVRTAEAATHGLNAALSLAFRGGAVTGLLVVG